ncbi:MAG TPA: hypothetical protein VMP08_17310, partial [Anaerolineae bacterium]|nr:hypothetical protein [Anaerolineae bacterium]
MDIIHYESLTFPDVAALPRDIPIVIPLGEIDADTLVKRVRLRARSALSSEQICVFPAVPFGFEGSPLAVAPRLFKRLIDSLVASIEEDGFTNVSVIKHPERSGRRASAALRSAHAKPVPVAQSKESN